MTLACVRSLSAFGPKVREILLINNNSDDASLEPIASYASDKPCIKVLNYHQPFNYQKLNNWAVTQSTGKLLLFVNNDVELVSESAGLIERMAVEAQKPATGAVGCLLLYGDKRTIQHAGVFLVPGGLADHLYVGRPYARAIASGGHSKVYPYDITQTFPVTAVTGAVTLVERTKFDRVGMFDERFILCGGDVDLCIRLDTAGYQTVFVGQGFMLHKESQSRTGKPIPHSDFCYSYLSYKRKYDTTLGDPYLPRLTQGLK